ncbi:MAG: hypothetical protein AAF402_05380 [Pseudomonadota bacterium]
MTSESIENRRAALKSILSGSGVTVAGAWVAPIVMTVSLPAHASTTAADGDAGEGEETPMETPEISSGLFMGSGQIPVTTVLPD